MIFCYEPQFNTTSKSCLSMKNLAQKQENKLSIYSFSNQYVEDVSWTTKKHIALHKIQNIFHSPARHNNEHIYTCDAEGNRDLTFLCITCRL